MGNRVVYQPAYEAEVEYLESTGTQWIDTGVNPDNTYTFDCKVATTHIVDGNYVFWGCRDMQNNAIIAQCFLFVSNMSSYDGEKIRLITTNSWADNGNWNSGIVPTQNTMYELVGMTSVSTMNAVSSTIAIFGFTTNGATSAGISKCRIGYWKCYSNGQIVRDFIPVRIGTTGYMYDKVSRQLFANAGTGQFVLGNDVANATVPQLRHVVYFGGQRCVGFEKVYEKCAWLKGRNGAYIDTLHKLIPCDDAFECHFKWDGETANPNGKTQCVFGCYFYQGANSWMRVAIAYDLFYVNYFKLVNWNTIPINGVNDVEIKSLMSSSDSGNYSFTLNGETHEYSNNGLSKIGTNADVLLFENIANNGTYFHGDIAHFRITDPTFTINRVNMFPCRLLVDIPAILDGNGIARQAGTCGMWDTVSGRFFGNVADRGTFDVVYFEEGVDYEVHYWLVGEINTQGTMMQFGIGKNFSFKRRMYSGSNTGYFYGSGYSYYTNTSYFTLIIWETSSSSNVFTLQPPTSGEDITIESTTSRLTFNGTEVPSYCNSYNFIITSQNNSGTKCATSSITIDGIERYIPVKLLKSIPSKYDANGIARQAGECGMYDTVNDLFYGNVSPSGTFTVADD